MERKRKKKKGGEKQIADVCHMTFATWCLMIIFDSPLQDEQRKYQMTT